MNLYELIGLPVLGQTCEDDDGPSLAERRARWERRESRDGQRARKKRKRETNPRAARFGHMFQKGDRRRRVLDSSTSAWWELINHPDVRNPTSWAGQKFRRTFRLPMTEVDKLLAQASRKPEWKDKPKGAGNGRGPPRHPLILKLLAALRHLAKGHDPDDLEDVARISAPVLRTFIKQFVDWLSEELYPDYVKLPDAAKLRARTGLGGCLRGGRGGHQRTQVWSFRREVLT
jgi:hypothetical protein